MKRTFTTGFFTLFAAVLSPVWAPATGIAVQGPPGADATITIRTDDNSQLKCDISAPTLRCNGARCRRGARVNWKVDNNYTEDATVVLLNFRIDVNGTDWYVDPLRQIGQGANRAEHYVDVDAGQEGDIRTLVREIEHEFFRGTYNYDIAIRFNDTGDFAVCPDPMLDIDG